MTIRLNNEIRRRIARALTDRKFGKEEKALESRRIKLGMDVYCATYTALERSRMNRLPEGWLGTTGALHASFAGQSAYLKLGKRVRMPNSEKDMRFAFDHPLSVEWNAIYRDETRLKENRQAAYQAAMGAMHKCQTVEKLLKVWPEVKPFVPETLTAQVTGALAIPIPQLNTMLGLP